MLAPPPSLFGSNDQTVFAHMWGCCHVLGLSQCEKEPHQTNKDTAYFGPDQRKPTTGLPGVDLLLLARDEWLKTKVSALMHLNFLSIDRQEYLLICFWAGRLLVSLLLSLVCLRRVCTDDDRKVKPACRPSLFPPPRLPRRKRKKRKKKKSKCFTYLFGKKKFIYSYCFCIENN